MFMQACVTSPRSPLHVPPVYAGPLACAFQQAASRLWLLVWASSLAATATRPSPLHKSSIYMWTSGVCGRSPAVNGGAVQRDILAPVVLLECPL
jgi:hypothetical protein